MDQITAAAAVGDEETVARLTVQANLEDVDRRKQATPLPGTEGDDLAVEAALDQLRRRVVRAHNRGDAHGEADARARLAAFAARTGRS